MRFDHIDLRQAMQDPRIKQVEYCDDRFAATAHLEGEINLFYGVCVAPSGKFVMSPIYAEDLYQPMVHGVAEGGETVVVPDGKDGAGMR